MCKIKKVLKPIRIAILTIVTSLLFSFNTSVFAYPIEHAVSLQSTAQEQTQWCWAACAVGCIKYVRGTAPTQPSFVRTVKGSIINVQASLSEIKSGMAQYIVSSVYENTYLSFDAIKSELYNYNSPILAAWDWNPSGGHAVTLDGYSSTSETNYVDYMDPSNGSFNYVTYTYFRGGNLYDHTWYAALRRIC